MSRELDNRDVMGLGISPSQFGAVGDGVTDDTAIVQYVFDTFGDRGNIKFTANYAVTEVTYRGILGKLDFNGYKLVGVSDTPGTGSIINLRCVYCDIFTIWTDAENNPNYGSSVRCYGINANELFAQNNIFGIMMWNATYGLVIGALEGQPVGEVFGSNISESHIYGLHAIGVERVIYQNQPNGYNHIIGGAITVQDNGNPAWDWDTSYCVHNECSAGGNIILSNVNIVNSNGETQGNTGKGLIGKNIHCTEIIMEVKGYHEVTGNMNIDGRLIDGGDGFYEGGYFQLSDTFDTTAGAALRLTNCFFMRPDGTAEAFGETLVSGTENTQNVRVEINDCTLLNYDWISDSLSYSPIVKDANLKMDNCRYIIRDGVGTEIFNGFFNVDGSSTIFNTADPVGHSLTIIEDTTTKGGWVHIFGPTSAGHYIKKNVVDVPVGYDVCIEVASTSGNSGQYTTATGTNGFVIKGANKKGVVSCLMKEFNDLAGSVSIVDIAYYDFAGNPCSVGASTERLCLLQNGQLPFWRRQYFRFEAPVDAFYAALILVPENGKQFGITDITVTLGD